MNNQVIYNLSNIPGFPLIDENKYFTGQEYSTKANEK